MLYWHDWAQKLYFFLNFQNLVFHFIAFSRFELNRRKPLLKYFLRLNVCLYNLLLFLFLKILLRDFIFNLDLLNLFLLKIFLYLILALIIFKLIKLVKTFDRFIFGPLKLIFLWKNIFIRLHSIILLFW